MYVRHAIELRVLLLSLLLISVSQTTFYFALLTILILAHKFTIQSVNLATNIQRQQII